MSDEIEQAIERICTHAWGTASMNSPNILSDSLLKLELGESSDVGELRSQVLNDLQVLNLALRKQNADEVQPASIPMKLAYSISRISCLLLNMANRPNLKCADQLMSFAIDFASAWHCVLSCDIEDVREGF